MRMRCYRSGVRDTDLLDAVCNLIRRDCGKELGINSVQNAEITESGGQGTAGQASSVADDSVSADMQDSVKKVKCINVACRSRGPMTCIHRMCFFCCFNKCKETECVCEAHAKQAKRREEENRLIEQTLLAPKVRRLYHFKEERITGVGQTVVLFCLRDFLKNPKWSRETLDLEMRRERQMRSLLRRERLRHPSSTETQGTKPPTNDKHCSRGTKVQTVDASGPRDIKVWRHRQQAAVRYQGILAKWARKMESE